MNRDDHRRPRRPAEPRARRFARRYSALALLVVNTLVVLALANAAAALFLAVHDRLWAPPPGSLRYGIDRLLPLYPGLDRSEVEQLLVETWSREYVYSPLVQHREGPLSGRFVNVHPAGFRHSANQAPWPPDPGALNLFVYGGSTTYGYGVADAETIPSHLQAELQALGCGPPVAVYNFGRGNYYSEQERVLFESHLTAGLQPDAALFIDGVNEWKDEPKFTPRLEYLLRESEDELWLRALKSLPIVDLARLLRGSPPDAEHGSIEAAEADAQRWLARWLRSKRLIAAAGRELGVVTLFAWQPGPAYDYELERHPFAAETAAAFAGIRYRAARHAYELVDRHRASHPALEPAGDFLWLADMQRGSVDPLYVDAVHYSGRFNRDLAARIALFAAARLGCPSEPDAQG